MQISEESEGSVERLTEVWNPTFLLLWSPPDPTEDLTPFLLFYFLLPSCHRCLCAWGTRHNQAVENEKVLCA